MIIKKYVADTMSEALNLIRLELGPQALIVNKRFIRQKGIRGMFLPKRLEVTAALDVPERNIGRTEGVSLSKDNANKMEIEQEIYEVKEMLQKLTAEKQKKIKREKKTGIRKLLLERDVSEDVINSILKSIKEKEEYKNLSRISDAIFVKGIGEVIKTGIQKNGRVQAFIGPTGVGKTTTIAKIAAFKALNMKNKVGLVTIDTYRIGAVEQLKIYADILGLPFEVVNTVGDIQRCFDRLGDCDSILVDTTGRSIKNAMQLSELKLYLDRIKPDVTYLTVSMTTKYIDLLEILKGFGQMNYNSIILTKLDETAAYGSILNVAYNAKVPISYIAVGQNVPDDIEKADKDKLLNLLIGEGRV